VRRVVAILSQAIPATARPQTTTEISEQTTRPASLDGCPSLERTPGFPVEFPGVGELHAAFLNESRTRIRWWSPVQEIRVHGPKKTGAATSNASATRAKQTTAKSKNPLAWSESI
jgi:hypothetical protein